ncbi:hypothetical protein ACYPKM_04275 [Pseudomonas aeruginosa]
MKEPAANSKKNALISGIESIGAGLASIGKGLSSIIESFADNRSPEVRAEEFLRKAGIDPRGRSATPKTWAEMGNWYEQRPPAGASHKPPNNR